MRDEERDRQLAIATTILAQLGGNRFAAMTGASNFVGLTAGLMFKLPGGGGGAKQGINRVEIELEPADLYTIRFSNIRFGRLDMQIKTISEHFGIYHDQLRGIFTAETGLDTHL